ncbi:MAG: diaminopimelate decarboxylase [Bdellovibrionota bacterium]
MFRYQNDVLSVVQGPQSVAVADLVGQDPAYIYDLDGIIERYQFVAQSFENKASVHFAMKANNNPKILKALAKAGCGVDVVSGGELKRALECGFAANKIVFSGVGKTEKEIEQALKAGVFQINLESSPELQRVIQLTLKLKPSTKPRLAIRVNPDVNPETHPNIKTGFRDNKFGLDFEEIPELLKIFEQNKSLVSLVGLTLHIGSQIREASPFFEAIDKTLKLYKEIEKKGFFLETFDVGGGFGIDYSQPGLDGKPKLVQTFMAEEKAYEEYTAHIMKKLKSEVKQILTEPGRFIVGHFGVLVSEIQYIKRTPYKSFAILNSGMNHLMRPALYEAYHHISPLNWSPTSAQEKFDIVGPICESTDVFGFDRYLPKDIKQGDHLAIFDAGAYGAVMANDYNLHALPVETVVSKGKVI